MGSSTKEGSGIPQLNGTNFENWRFRVQLYLDAAEVSEALTGQVPGATDAGRAKFLQTDRKAKSLLVGFLSDECLGIVRDKETARDMWKALEDTYAKKSVASQTLLRKQLARLRMKEGTSMRHHFQQFDDIVRQLKTAGAKLEENDTVSQLFLTLPDSYDSMVTALENINEKDLTLETVKQRLLAEESKRSDRMEDSHEDRSAAFVGGRNKKPKKFAGKCHRCGKVGHMQKDCHVKKPEGKVNAAVSTKSVSFMVNKMSTKTEHKKSVFVVDSGCSDHLVNSLECMQSVRKLRQPFVIDVAKDGVSIIGQYEGEVTGLSREGVRFEMKNVIFVPELRGNLLSVKKMSEAGIDVLFTSHGGKHQAMMKKDDSVIGVAHLRGNLYELDLTLDVTGATANLCRPDAGNLWHRRLGHASQTTMNKLVRHNMAEGFGPKVKAVGFCDTCVLGKQCREPFDGTRERASRLLERIHSDVCGPIDPPAWDGSKYFVSFIDDYSHFACIYLMKRKSEVFSRFQEYEAMVTVQFEKRISKLTVDQGREYCSKEQEAFYKRRGIQIQPTVAYSPQQNGVAERFNRTLIEKVRTMLIDSNMPKYMWSEAVLTGTYILNRCPTAALSDNRTPAEYWTGVKPDLSKLRIFGCKAFAWVPGQLRKKLDCKSREAVMVGYAPNGYRLWNRSSRKIFVARDIKFDENSLPYAIEDSQDSKVPLVIPMVYPDVEDDQQADVEDAISVSSDGEDEVEPEEQDDQQDEFEDAMPVPRDDEEDVEPSEEQLQNPGALPSHSRGDDYSESNTRRGERERRLPGKFLDFLTGFRATSAGKFSTFPDSPECYGEISSRNDRQLWLDAVDEELKSLEANKVWNLVPCPAGVKPLQSKWIFRTKEDEDGNPVRYKARLVVKGFLQKPGLDYNETYAPVAKLTTIRIVLAVGVQKGFHFHQMDVKTAFLHGELQEQIFMAVPDGVKARTGMVCQLKKSLYGLKQSPRCWNEKFNQALLKLGFIRSKHDYCLYTRTDERGTDAIFVVLYVDDLLIAGMKLSTIMKLKTELSRMFAMTDCGELSHFLGMKIRYNRQDGKMMLSQEASLEKIFQKFGMLECNPSRTPMEKGLQLDRQVAETIGVPYRELLGSLMYVMVSTRADICYPVGYLGRFQAQPGQQHWTALKRVVRYLKGTMDHCLTITRDVQAKPLVGFADADWATDTEDRKSVSGFVFQVFGSTIAWSSKKQTTVATSSSEAEYVALSAAASEAVWLTGVLGDLGEKKIEPVAIYEDNRGCIGMAKNAESKRVKHIDIKHHFLRDLVNAGKLLIEPIASKNQLADFFTKSLDAGRFEELRTKLGVSKREGVLSK